MAAKKRFVVLGLGSFGTALSTKLAENGCRVTGMDGRRERVDALKNTLYEAVIGDCTEREALDQLGLPDADAVFISLGEEIAISLLATLHVKELGAKRIIVRGVNPDHSRILNYLGVERVVFPETEVARELADRMTWPNVLDFLPIDPEYSIVEIAVPTSFTGETLRDVDLRRRFGVWVIGIKDAFTGQLQIFPDPEFKLNDDQLLLAVGKQTQIDELKNVQ